MDPSLHKLYNLLLSMLQWSELGQMVDLQGTEVIIHLHQSLDRFFTALHYVSIVICKELGGEGVTLGQHQRLQGTLWESVSLHFSTEDQLLGQRAGGPMGTHVSEILLVESHQKHSH